MKNNKDIELGFDVSARALDTALGVPVLSGSKAIYRNYGDSLLNLPKSKAG